MTTYTLKHPVEVDPAVVDRVVAAGGTVTYHERKPANIAPAGTALLLTNRRDHAGRDAFRVEGANVWLWLHLSEVE